MSRRQSKRAKAQSVADYLNKMITKDSSANFGRHPSEVPQFKTRDEVSDWIKESIRIYVQTWILPDVEDLVAALTK